MARLICASNMSLDGCTEDERGAFDWAPPDDPVFASITDLMRSAGTHLYGRRTANTQLERHFEPGAVQDLKAAASRDLIVGGPNLAARGGGDPPDRPVHPPRRARAAPIAAVYRS